MVPAPVLVLILMLSVAQDSRDATAAELQTWVDQLASPRRSERLAAQLHLIRLPSGTRELLASIQPPEGYEAREQLAYVVAHLASYPDPVAIPAGTYQVGSDVRDDRNPVRSVDIAAFRLDVTEVTNLDYYRFLQANDRSPPLHWALNGGRYGYGEEHHPVRGVSYRDALEYARWVGGRLPTTDEWEVAAHLGSGVPFPWGEEPLPRLRNAAGRPVPVQSEPRDRAQSGCFDMAASVSEWVQLPAGPGYRGGHYLSHREYFRIVRGALPVPDGSPRGAVGFRVADRPQR